MTVRSKPHSTWASCSTVVARYRWEATHRRRAESTGRRLRGVRSVRPGSAFFVFRMASARTWFPSTSSRGTMRARTNYCRENVGGLAPLGRPRPEKIRIVGGDLNTMGCGDCGETTSALGRTARCPRRARCTRRASRSSTFPARRFAVRLPRQADSTRRLSAVGFARRQDGSSWRLFGTSRCSKVRGRAGGPPGPALASSDHCPLVLSLGAP